MNEQEGWLLLAEMLKSQRVKRYHGKENDDVDEYENRARLR